MKWITVAIAVMCLYGEVRPIAANADSQGDTYHIALRLEPHDGQFSGETILNYRNLGRDPLSEVRLRLDMNLGSKQSMSISSVKDGEDRDMEWNYARFGFAKFDSDKGQLQIKMTKPLEHGRTHTMKIRFAGQSVGINDEMITLQDDPFVSFDAWYPKAMTLRDGAWSIDDDRPSSYTISLDLPSAFVVAGSGRMIQEINRQGKRRIVVLQADGIRGFSVFASPSWKVSRMSFNGIDIAVHLPESAKKWAQPMLESCVDTIRYYEREYGSFPSKHLDIIGLGDPSGRAHGSSAGCNTIVVWLGGNFGQLYRWLLAHELAHQYFGSLVGLPRNEIGWAPIGLGLVMDRHYCESIELDYNQNRKTMVWFYEEAERRGFNTSLSQPVEELMSAPAPWSTGWTMSLAHGKALLVCSKFEEALGKSEMKALIHDIVRDKSGALLGGADLIAYVEKRLGRPLDQPLKDWINGSPIKNNP